MSDQKMNSAELALELVTRVSKAQTEDEQMSLLMDVLDGKDWRADSKYPEIEKLKNEIARLNEVIEGYKARNALLERQFDWRIACYRMEEEWRDVEIPYLKFPSDWEVQITPPFTGAIARFKVRYRCHHHWISVYLDNKNRLGLYGDGDPYWEIFPNEMEQNERFAVSDGEGLIEALELALNAQNERILAQDAEEGEDDEV